MNTRTMGGTATQEAPPVTSGPVVSGRSVLAQKDTVGLDRFTVSVVSYGKRIDDELDAELASSQEIVLVPSSGHADADVILVVTTAVTDAMLADLGRIADGAVNPRQCMVLVTGPMRERHLARAVSCGVVSILPLREATARLVVRAVRSSYRGGAVLPETVTRWLVDEARVFQQNMLATQGLSSGGLTAREVEVLKFLADGQSTEYIAEHLSYSERTIKKIIGDMLARLALRNRAHAVSYAMRVGAI